MSNIARGASADVICSASTIPRRTLRSLFRGPRLRVPVFQRRYCWGRKQFAKLAMDVIALASRPGPAISGDGADALQRPLSPYDTHSLGRLVLAEHPDMAGDLMVIDGQQRITTVCVLLGALRDILPLDSPVRASIQQLLYPSDRASDGGSGCVLTPTLFDRASFEACVGRPTEKPPLSISGHPDDHVAACRNFFDQALPGLLKRVRDKLGLKVDGEGASKERAAERVVEICARSLMNALMDSCTVLCFKMREQGEEVMAAYSRLAMRDAMLSFQLNNSAPGVKMEFLDLARNLVCCQFPGGGEKRRIDGYMRYWRPIEQWAMEGARRAAAAAPPRNGSRTSRSNQADSMVSILDKLLKAFVADEGHAPSASDNKRPKATARNAHSKWMDPGQYAFPMYTQLQACVTRAAKTPGGVEDMLVRLRAKAESMGESNQKSTTGSMAPPTPVPGGGGDVKPCACMSRGTLCVDCIVKNSGSR